MFELGLVAAAISSIIDYPVKTFDECVANGVDVLPNQILDLDIVHKYSFVRQDDDRPVQEPSFTQDFEIVDEGDEGDVRDVNRRSFVRRGDEVQVNPDSSILPPRPIQIFVKTSFGKSHSMFVFPNSTVLELKQTIQEKLHIDGPISLGFSCNHWMIVKL